MILIKEITAKNITQFSGLPANILVVLHKEIDIIVKHNGKHSFDIMGIVICEHSNAVGKYFYIQFATGGVTGSYPTLTDMLDAEAECFRFFYIEIKKQL